MFLFQIKKKVCVCVCKEKEIIKKNIWYQRTVWNLTLLRSKHLSISANKGDKVHLPALLSYLFSNNNPKEA